MKRKLTSVFLALILVLALPVMAAAATGTVELIDTERNDVRIVLSGIDTSAATSTFTIHDEYSGDYTVPIYPANGPAEATMKDTLYTFFVKKMVSTGEKTWSFDGEVLPITGKCTYRVYNEAPPAAENTGSGGYDTTAIIGGWTDYTVDIKDLPEEAWENGNFEYEPGCKVTMSEPGLYYIYGSIGPVLGCTEAFVRVLEAPEATPAAPTASTVNALPAGALNGYVPADWAKPEVYAARDSALIPVNWGYSRNSAGNIDREAFCELATRLYCVDNDYLWEMIAPAFETPVFTDTSSMEVLQMNKLGVVDGTGSGKFSPQGELTREQAAKILTLLYNTLEPGAFNATADYWTGKNVADSAKVSSWAQNYVGFVLEKGIMNGVGNNKFDPQGKYTYAQATLTMYRLAGKAGTNLYAAPAGTTIHDLGILRSHCLEYALIPGCNVASITCTSAKLGGKSVPFTVNTSADGSLSILLDTTSLGEIYNPLGMHLVKFEIGLTVTMKDGAAVTLTDTFQYIDGGFGGA